MKLTLFLNNNPSVYFFVVFFFRIIYFNIFFIYNQIYFVTCILSSVLIDLCFSLCRNGGGACTNGISTAARRCRGVIMRMVTHHISPCMLSSDSYVFGCGWSVVLSPRSFEHWLRLTACALVCVR